MELLSPEGIESALSHPFVASYWPLLLGGPVVFLFMIKGYNWVAVPLGALLLAYQAWHTGLIH